MGFLAPFAAPIIGGISSLVGSKLSGGSGGVPGINNIMNTIGQNVKTGGQIATNLGPQAQNLLNQSTAAYSPALNYWSSLLGGNRQAATAAAAPDINRINEGYDAQTQAAGNLMPRGGGRSAFFTEAPFQRQRDITSTLQTARTSAAPNLLHAGEAIGNTASGLYGHLLSALTGNTNNLLNYDLQSREQQYKKGKEIGGSIFDLLKGIDFSKLGKQAPGAIPLPFPSPFPAGGGMPSDTWPGTPPIISTGPYS